MRIAEAVAAARRALADLTLSEKLDAADLIQHRIEVEFAGWEWRSRTAARIDDRVVFHGR
jgi:hypothetical protein